MTRTFGSAAPLGMRPTPARVADQAYMQLEELIVTLQLSPGSTVSESALSRRLGISRTPIREALQRLSREGLVTVLPQRGIRISELDAKMQLRLLTVRREIEKLMARLCAVEASADARRYFGQIAQGLFKAASEDDDQAFLSWDMALNNALIGTAQNEFATGAMRLMAGLSRRFWFAYREELAMTREAARLHAPIAQAIAEGAAEKAASAVEDLMDFNVAFTAAAANLG